jgi:hypothetical protein
MALKKMEFFITPTSTTTIPNATTTVVGILNSTQEATTNKLTETTYKDDYFAGLFDSRDKKTYLVFSDIAKAKYGMSDSLMDITPDAGGSVDLTGYATEQYVDDAIANIDVGDGTETYVIG